jgi:hypothetical protein
MRIQTGDNAGIAGFIIASPNPPGGGDPAKRVLIRALGPSLTQFGVQDALTDPILSLHGPNGPVTRAINDNWKDNQQGQIEATGIPPTNNLESAILDSLLQGAYTAVATSKDGTSPGVGLVEIYDLDPDIVPRIAELSTRALVGTGDDIVIAGFTLGGRSGDDRIAIRGIGPSLASSGVTNPLPDPKVELRNSSGTLVAANNDWQEDLSQAAELTARGLAPNDNREAALIRTLAPGQYTALLSGVNNSIGIGLVEVYDLAQ